jgi:hypothetical protein
MKTFKYNDRVKKIGEPIYFNISEVLPGNYYVATVDSPDYIAEIQYIIDGTEIEFVRGPEDPNYLLPEMEIIGYEDPDEFEEYFDDKMELYDLIRQTEFPEYNNKLNFTKNESGILVIYITL